MSLPWIGRRRRVVLSQFPARTASLTVIHAKWRAGLVVGALVTVVGACGTSGMAIVATETAHHAPAALSWTVTPLGPAEFNAVACSAPTYCVALGPDGWMASSDDGGAQWTTGRMASFDNTTFDSVVCPSASRCVAIGFDYEAISVSGYSEVGVAAVSLDGGRHWRHARISGSVYLSGGLACPTPDVCYAAASGLHEAVSGFLLVSTDGGLTWPTSSGEPKYELDGAISCPEVRSCWATGGRYGLVTTTNGGRSWTLRHGPLGAGGLVGVSSLYCRNMLRCIAVGIEHSPGYPVVFVTDDGGSSWGFASFRSSSALLEEVDGFGSLASVTCSTAQYCVAVGAAAIGWPIVVTSNDGGESWQMPTMPPLVSGGGLTDVACGALDGCVIVGSTRNDAPLIALSRPDQTWDTRLQGVGSNWSSISCPGLGHCVAVGSYSAVASSPKGAEVLTSTDSGLRWQQRATPASVIALSGVDCPSVNRCFATAYVAAPPDLVQDVWVAALLRSNDGGRTWRRESLPKALLLAAISCPTSSTCYAVGGMAADSPPTHDSVVKTVDGGTHWLDQPVPNPLGAAGLDAVSCPTARRCWAVGQSGALATTNGGRTWWYQKIAGAFQAIACPSEQMCVVVNNASSPGSPIYVTLDGGRTWSARSVPVADPQLTGVSCPTTSECVAVGSSWPASVVLASFDGGRHWTVQPVPQPGAFGSYDTVQCTAPRHCVVLGGGPIAQLAIGS